MTPVLAEPRDYEHSRGGRRAIVLASIVEFSANEVDELRAIKAAEQLAMIGTNGAWQWRRTALRAAAVDEYLEGETELPSPVRPTDRAIAL